MGITTKNGQFVPRLEWEQCGTIPAVTAVASYTERPDELDDFHSQRLIAKGDLPAAATPERKVQLALQLVKPMLTQEYVDKVYRSVLSHIGSPPDTPVTVQVPLSVRDTKLSETATERLSSNMVSVVFALELTKQLNRHGRDLGHKVTFSNEKRLVRVTKDQSFNVLGRANADVVGRFVQLSRYDGSQIAEGDPVLIVDDHIQNGAIVKAMLDAVIRNKGKVVGIATLAAVPESIHLQPTFDVSAFMEKTLQYAARNAGGTDENFAKVLDETLDALGFSLHSITPRETLALAAMFLDGSKQEQRDFFNRYCALAGVDPNLKEAARDSIRNTLLQPPITPEQFGKRIAERITSAQAMEGPPHAK